MLVGGFSTDVAIGITYIANLFKVEKESGGNVLPPEGIINPIIISMSLGGPSLSPLEKSEIDYAIEQGVFIIAASGNEGDSGMSYPGAYQPVISVGAIGWIGEWSSPSWWRTLDVPENLTYQIYVTDFSSRVKDGQDLDVLAPGSWIVGPYTAYGAAHSPYWAKGIPGQYYYLEETSMATPHVSEILALALQLDMNNNGIDLIQQKAEELLENPTFRITWYSLEVAYPNGSVILTSWEKDALGDGGGVIQADIVIQNLLELE